jgi:hypothetical protein
LLTDLLNDRYLRRESIETNMFELLGNLLAKVANLLDEISVKAIDSLCHTFEDCRIMAVESIILNFDIWRSTHFLVQKSAMLMLARHLRDDREFYRGSFGLQRLLDVLRNYYPFGEPPSDVFNSLGTRTKLSQWELTELRAILLSGIEDLLAESIELEEVNE